MSRINLTQQDFERAVRKFCPDLVIQHGYFNGQQMINSGLYHNGKYQGAIPALEFYLLTRLSNGGYSVKQLGLIHTAKKLSTYIGMGGYKAPTIKDYHELLDAFQIFGWHRAMLLTHVTKSFGYGIGLEEFEENKEFYPMNERA